MNLSRRLDNIATMITRRHIIRVLRRRGLEIGRNVYIQSPEYIDGNLPWLVSIGDDCVVSRDVMILAHDASMQRHLGFVEIGKVTIGRRTYIGAGTVILPGVTIGNDVIVGAGSVVTKDIPSNSVAAGNPARVIRSTSEFIEEHRKNILKHSIHLHRTELNYEDKRIILEALIDGSYYYRSSSRA